jgi:hypothetical protein
LKLKKKSPKRFIIKAFKAAFTACVRVVQKLINKNELKPIPSHPKKKITKLSEQTNTNIKNVKRDK